MLVAPPGAGPQAREGENVFGVAHIFASFNDTFVVRPASALLTQASTYLKTLLILRN